MKISEALDFIHSVNWKGSRLGLERIIELLGYLDNPHKKLKFIHVAGTNGKGSTCAMLSSILTAAGYKTGLHISPHLLRIHERFIIDGQEISNDELGEVATEVKKASQNMKDSPTEFEIIFAMSLLYYYKNECDIVVLEVGLGGELDATNCIPPPEVAVITNIGLDHTEILSNNIEEIARVKAGIIKENSTVVLYPCAENIKLIFQEVCMKKNAYISIVDFKCLKIIKSEIMGQVFDWNNYKSLSIPLIGEHQARNAAIVLETVSTLIAKGYNIDESSIRIGLKEVKWNARLEVLCKNPLFLLDGGHNIQGTTALFETMNSLFPKIKIVFILGVLRDKDYKEMISIIKPISKSIICVTPDSDRALPSAKLFEYVKSCGIESFVCEDEKSAIIKAIEIGEGGPLVAFGSLYMAGKIRSEFSLALKNFRRQTAINSRNNLSEELRETYSEQITQNILNNKHYKNAKTIMIYRAVKGEVNVDNIVEKAKALNKTIVYPYCESDGIMNPMLPNNDSSWTSNKYNILEPDPSQSYLIDPTSIDLVICPCTVLDHNGNRIGMGAGYYDRFLPRCVNAHIIGVAFGCQLFDELYPNKWDVKMDGIITESTNRECNNSSEV